MEQNLVFKIVFIILGYIGYVSVNWNRFKEIPREKAEKNARSSTLVLLGLVIIIFILAPVLVFLEGITKPLSTLILMGKDFWFGTGLSICMVIASVGIWFKKRWSIAFNFILTPVVIYYIVSALNIRPIDFFVIVFLLFTSTFFLVDIWNLYKHWNA